MCQHHTHSLAKVATGQGRPLQDQQTECTLSPEPSEQRWSGTIGRFCISEEGDIGKTCISEEGYCTPCTKVPTLHQHTVPTSLKRTTAHHALKYQLCNKKTNYVTTNSINISEEGYCTLCTTVPTMKQQTVPTSLKKATAHHALQYRQCPRAAQVLWHLAGWQLDTFQTGSWQTGHSTTCTINIVLCSYGADGVWQTGSLIPFKQTLI